MNKYICHYFWVAMYTHGQNNCHLPVYWAFRNLFNINSGKMIVNKVNKTALMQGHLKHLHVSKEVLTTHHYGKNPDLYWEISILGHLSEVHVH